MITFMIKTGQPRQNHRLPDGVGTNGVFTKGPQILYILSDVVTLDHILTYFAACLAGAAKTGQPRQKHAAPAGLRAICQTRGELEHRTPTPSPHTKSFPTKSPRVEVSGKPPIKLYGHENSHPLELRVRLSQAR